MALREHIEYAAVATLLGLCRILPEPAVYALFRSMALLFYHLSANRRKLTLNNIEIVFPEKTLAERKQLARKSFVNISESLAFNTLVMCGRIDKARMLEYVDAPDWEAFEQSLNGSDIGDLFISAHIGNWELLVQYISSRLSTPVHVIARQSNNALLEERVVLPLRKRFGLNVIYKKSAMFKLTRALKKNEIAGLMIDQRLNLQQGIFVPFFNRETGTTSTPALLQTRLGCTTRPIFMIKTGKQKYRLIVSNPILWTDDGSPNEEQIKKLTKRHQEAIEEIIRQYPDQWFWMHNRWGLSKAERK